MKPFNLKMTNGGKKGVLKHQAFSQIKTSILLFNRSMEIGGTRIRGMCFLSYRHWEKYKINEGEVIYCGALKKPVWSSYHTAFSNYT